MAHPNRYNFLTYLSVNPNRYHILGALARRAGDPPEPFGPHEILDELSETGEPVYPAHVNNEIRELVKFGLIAVSKDRHRVGGSFVVPAAPFWEDFARLAESVDAVFPPEPSA